MPETLTQNRILKLDRRDNLIIALTDLRIGEEVNLGNETYTIVTDIPAKHKFALKDFAPEEHIIMYGVVVGKATQPIRKGELITTRNIRHEAAEFHQKSESYSWHAPDVSAWKKRTFHGYKRVDGQVGTRNYWLVVPLVFCENRNIDVLRKAFDEGLGYAPPQVYRQQVAALARLYREGRLDAIKTYQQSSEDSRQQPHGFFENIDGVKFLTHERGCGGTREDARNLCGLIAGYLHHPNVAGATVLSLGCQHSQADILREEIAKRDPDFAKPLILLEHQKSASERAMLSQAIRETFLGLVEVNRVQREPASLDKLSVGLKCGGSDGFSGLTANPLVGRMADRAIAAGGSAILSEIPEVFGAERLLMARARDEAVFDAVVEVVNDFKRYFLAHGESVSENPSPGNIAGGITTLEEKSLGAVQKAGHGPLEDVLRYGERVRRRGLTLLEAPGNDAVSSTALAAAGATVILFTTGRGTPLGFPVPTVKIASNSDLAQRKGRWIDFDAGEVLRAGFDPVADALVRKIVAIASGEETASERNGEREIAIWKRGVTL